MGLKEYCLVPSSLLLAIVAIFLLVPNAVALLSFSGSSFLSGEFWRLVTFPFVHLQAGHLAENIVALLVASLLAYEVGVTAWQYIVAFAAAALVVAVIDVVWFPFLVVVGASSGIFAVYGAFAARGSEFVSKLWLIPILATTVLVKWGLEVLAGGVEFATTIQTVLHMAGFITGCAIILVTHHITTERRRVLRCAA
jgi:rhomboid protease GluP